MSSFDHRNIVGSITYGQSYFVKFLSNHPHHLSFLQGQQPTADHWLTFLSNGYKVNLQLISGTDLSEVSSLDHQWHFAAHTQVALTLLPQFNKWVNNSLGCSVGEPDGHDLKALLDQVATLGNILSCLQLITCQHPHLYVCPDHVPQSIRNFILQSIQNGRSSN